MEIYSNEDEQVDRIKKWIKEYGPTIAISILIVVLGTFGWRYWNEHQNTTRANASNYYEQLVNSAMNNDTTAVSVRAKALMENYESTPYSKLAALLLAKQDVLQGKMASAKQQLNWVIQNSDAVSLKQIAKNRLAKLLIAEKKPGAALKILETLSDKSYLAAVDALRGDAYVALRKVNKAKQAYKKALTSLPKNSDSRPLLEMKLTDLPA